MPRVMENQKKVCSSNRKMQAKTKRMPVRRRKMGADTSITKPATQKHELITANGRNTQILMGLLWLYCLQVAGIGERVEDGDRERAPIPAHYPLRFSPRAKPSEAHLYGHKVVSFLLSVNSCVTWPYQRLVPVYGWYFNLDKPHDIMMCKFETRTYERSPFVNMMIGMAGVEGQLLWMLAIGWLFHTRLGMKDVWGDFRNYALFMGLWTWGYCKGYIIHFYDDCTGDFAFLTACGRVRDS